MAWSSYRIFFMQRGKITSFQEMILNIFHVEKKVWQEVCNSANQDFCSFFQYLCSFTIHMLEEADKAVSSERKSNDFFKRNEVMDTSKLV